MEWDYLHAFESSTTIKVITMQMLWPSVYPVNKELRNHFADELSVSYRVDQNTSIKTVCIYKGIYYKTQQIVKFPVNPDNIIFHTFLNIIN